MPRLTSFVSLAIAAAFGLGLTTSAAAESMLYATAASQGRVDGFRLRADGTPEGDPAVEVATNGRRPRRLRVRGCNLYVAEDNRIEVFRIASTGKLTRIGATRRDKRLKANDFVLAEDGRTLYAPINNRDIIAAYPLDENGIPNADPLIEDGVTSGGPTSCAYGRFGSGLEDMAATNGKLYAVIGNRVSVFGLDAQGRIVGAPRVARDLDGDGDIDEDEQASPVCTEYSTTTTEPSACVERGEDRPDDTCALSFRRSLSAPIGLIVDGKTVVTGERFTRRLQGFALDDAFNFPKIAQPDPNDPDEPDPFDPTRDSTRKERKAERKSRKKNRTDDDVRYLGLTLHRTPERSVVFATTFDGRVDAFRLQPGDDGVERLPKSPSSRTRRDVTGSPVRSTIRPATANRNAVLYLAAGELDRVEAYRLTDAGGLLLEATPFARTNVRKGSFPNDVVTVDTDACD
jgi:hypothetical protein